MPRRDPASAGEFCRAIVAGFGQRGPILNLIQPAVHSRLRFVCPIHRLAGCSNYQEPRYPHGNPERAIRSCAGVPRRSSAPPLAVLGPSPVRSRAAIRAAPADTVQPGTIFQKSANIFSGGCLAAGAGGVKLASCAQPGRSRAKSRDSRRNNLPHYSRQTVMEPLL